MSGSLRRRSDIRPVTGPVTCRGARSLRVDRYGPLPPGPTVHDGRTAMRLHATSGARRPPPRHRAPRPRSVAAAWAALLTLVVALVLSGPAAPSSPAYAESDQPTVSFVGSGPAPLACSSRPDVPNMTIKKNTRIVLANFTGADAKVTL